MMFLKNVPESKVQEFISSKEVITVAENMLPDHYGKRIFNYSCKYGHADILAHSNNLRMITFFDVVLVDTETFLKAAQYEHLYSIISVEKEDVFNNLRFYSCDSSEKDDSLFEEAVLANLSGQLCDISAKKREVEISIMAYFYLKEKGFDPSQYLVSYSLLYWPCAF